MIRLEPGSAEYAFAYAFWSRLKCAAVTGDAPAAPIRIEACVEEAVVWRVLAWRSLTQLGDGTLFEKRDKGAATGTSVPHPALDAVAKMYERLRRSMSELTEDSGKAGAVRPKGLPDLMKPILEEAEVVFDELLGPRGFPGRASKNGLDRGANPGE